MLVCAKIHLQEILGADMCDLSKLKRYTMEDYGSEEIKDGMWVKFDDVQNLLNQEPFNTDDYEFEINDLKTYDQWSGESRGILKGSKSVGKNEKGIALFHKNQTTNIPCHSSDRSAIFASEQFDKIKIEHVGDLKKEYDDRYWVDIG
jgi:hypothetical protein